MGEADAAEIASACEGLSYFQKLEVLIFIMCRTKHGRYVIGGALILVLSMALLIGLEFGPTGVFIFSVALLVGAAVYLLIMMPRHK
jgi:hypothetical protein